MESAFHLHQTTGLQTLLEAGRVMVEGLQQHARVPGGGFANIRNVQGHVQEDHMSSFFLAETLAYLYLLFDDSFVKRQPYVPMDVPMDVHASNTLQPLWCVIITVQ